MRRPPSRPCWTTRPSPSGPRYHTIILANYKRLQTKSNNNENTTNNSSNEHKDICKQNKTLRLYAPIMIIDDDCCLNL